jgi:hypothetical protein
MLCREVQKNVFAHIGETLLAMPAVAGSHATYKLVHDGVDIILEPFGKPENAHVKEAPDYEAGGFVTR